MHSTQLLLLLYVIYRAPHQRLTTLIAVPRLRLGDAYKLAYLA